jgi:hypothetical protein
MFRSGPRTARDTCAMTESAAEPVLPVRLPLDMWLAVDGSLDDACLPMHAARDDTASASEDLESVRVRTVVDVEERQNGRVVLVITALPAQLNASRTAVEIADRMRDGLLTGIADLSDDAAGSATRLVVTLKRDVDPAVARDQILGAIAEQYRPTRQLATTLRELVRDQARLDDPTRTASQAPGTVLLTRDQWGFVREEIERHLPQPTWDQPAATNVSWQAMVTIGEQVGAI